MALKFGGLGIGPTLRGLPSNIFSLQPGNAQLIPAGDWYVAFGKYLSVQSLDPITGMWRWAGDNGQNSHRVTSDGANWRVVNQTGCVIGAALTTAGSGYTSAPTVTAAAGGAIFLPIIGGALNTAVTITSGGTGYTYPPLVQISAPPQPGIQATGFSTLTAGAVSSVTIVDQGAGYIFTPTFTFLNDPREGYNNTSVGSGASAVGTVTGAQTVTGLLVIDHGQAVTAVPALTFAGGGGTGAAATALMDFCITGVGVTGGGTAYPVSGNVEVSGVGGFVTTATAYANPTTQREALRRRRASITVPTTAGGALTATGVIIDDGGHYEAVPSILINSGTTIPTAAATLTITVGGITDVYGLFAA